MHASVMKWVGRHVEERQLRERSVLEVGSQNVNGSVRSLFRGRYIGMDMEDGRGVDLVARADLIPFVDDMFDVVVSTEMLEHDPFFWLSIPEMARVLRPGGDLLLTTRGIAFPRHDFPNDYWRFTPEAIGHLFELAGLMVVEVSEDPFPGHPGVFGLACKPV